MSERTLFFNAIVLDIFNLFKEDTPFSKLQLCMSARSNSKLKSIQYTVHVIKLIKCYFKFCLFKVFVFSTETNGTRYRSFAIKSKLAYVQMYLYFYQ